MFVGICAIHSVYMCVHVCIHIYIYIWNLSWDTSHLIGISKNCVCSFFLYACVCVDVLLLSGLQSIGFEIDGFQLFGGPFEPFQKGHGHKG